MRAPIFEAKFTGLTIKIVEMRKNPCKEKALQKYYQYGYRMVVLQATKENPSVLPNNYFIKLVSVTPAWTRDIHEKIPGHEQMFIVDRRDVVVDVEYTITRFNGRDIDRVDLYLRSMSDLLSRRLPITINHDAEQFHVPTTFE
ncbi:MAG: hypothetical protein RLZZ480_286 [Candidatus Parcubacteria bacterium]|jgi:hypothetical protein